MAGRKRTRHGRICGARNRKGQPCQCKLLFRGKKCRFHGGLSLTAGDKERISKETGRLFKKTGPATPDGKAKSYAARDAGRARRWQQHRLAALAGLADPRPRLGRAGEQ